jgi:hypothetical protein
MVMKSPSTIHISHGTLPVSATGARVPNWASITEGRKLYMTVEAHLATLKQKHGSLEEQLHAERTRPSGKDQTIVELKRQKLRLKDEIERLQAKMSH